jgi:DNA-binding CsgD family transcriptional regulator
MSSTAQQVHDRLDALAGAGLDSAGFARAALETLRDAVPFESACLASCDPDTHLLTGTTKLNLPDARDAEFAHFEYEIDDINTFREIGRRPEPIGVLALDTDGHPERSTRFREFLVPHFDHGNELRATARGDGLTWGLLGLYRPTSSTGFSAAEAAFVAAVSHTLARGLRMGLIVSASRREPVADGPAVLVLDAQNQVISASGAAAIRLEQLGASLWEELPIQLAAVVAGARALASGLTEHVPRARVRAADGQWLVIHAARLDHASGAGDNVVVTIEQARPPEVIPLLIAAFGLTAREQEVVKRVLAGDSTREIAGLLHMSPYTVQDHLKSIFAKCQVSSRRELIARVFFEHYAPAMGQPTTSEGRLLPR